MLESNDVAESTANLQQVFRDYADSDSDLRP